MREAEKSRRTSESRGLGGGLMYPRMIGDLGLCFMGLGLGGGEVGERLGERIEASDIAKFARDWIE